MVTRWHPDEPPPRYAPLPARQAGHPDDCHRQDVHARRLDLPRLSICLHAQLLLRHVHLPPRQHRRRRDPRPDQPPAVGRRRMARRPAADGLHSYGRQRHRRDPFHDELAVADDRLLRRFRVALPPLLPGHHPLHPLHPLRPLRPLRPATVSSDSASSSSSRSST